MSIHEKAAPGLKFPIQSSPGDSSLGENPLKLECLLYQTWSDLTFMHTDRSTPPFPVNKQILGVPMSSWQGGQAEESYRKEKRRIVVFFGYLGLSILFAARL